MDVRNVDVLVQRNVELEKELAAKNRELDIEAALERVRARTMAMQNSEELQESAKLLFQQVKAFGLPLISCGYNIWESDEMVCTAWMSDSSGSLLPPFQIPLTETPTFIRFRESRQNGEAFYSEEVRGKDLAAHYNYMASLPNFKDIINDFQQAGFALPSYQINHVINFSHGNLVFITDKPVPAAWDIFKRFTVVFGQTYTRFLDLKKAEAQAREAQIQLALERVRARTMAMQRSSELTEVAQLLFQQVKELGINAWTTGFNIWSDDNNYYTDYITSPGGGVIEPYTIDATHFPAFKEISDARKRGEEFYVSYLEGETLKQTYLELGRFGDKQQYEKMLEGGFQFPARQFNHFVFGSKVSLMFITYEPMPEAHAIFKRFGKVFEQTYIRFLDLQKAEAQAREARIEVALEKVRSRSLAMHKSEELKEVVAAVFEKLRNLEFAMNDGAAIIMTFLKDSKDNIQWIADRTQVFAACFKVPYSEHSLPRDIINAKESGVDFFSKVYPFEEKNAYFKYLFEYIDDYQKMPDEVKYLLLQTRDYGVSIAFQKNSAILIPNHTGKLVSQNEKEILKRFAKVFEQCYIRFLDLQKAEGQARESQIEAALERVRSRTMAMQRSDELPNAALLMFHQLQALGVPQFACGFNIWDEDKKAATAWMAGDDRIQPPFKTSSSEDVFLKIFEAAKRGESLFVEEQGGEKLEAHYRYMASIPVFREVMEKMSQDGLSVPTFQIMHCAFFSQGYLLFITYEPVAKVHDVFKRFAKVFEQTYTRFLDLQKAEAQAREAQIELGLERVRARAMAMQNSEELNALIGTVFTELTKLDLVLTRCVIQIYEGKEKGVRWWMANSETPSTPMNFFVKYADLPYFNACLQGWNESTLKLQYVMEGQNKLNTDDFLFKETELSLLPDFVIAGMRVPEKVYLNSSFNNFGYLTLATLEPLSDEHFNIMLRFAKVFDLTYTRFNDLKKAEAQAREAQIQLALERIRSRSLAMHHSNELKDVVGILFQQLKILGLEFDGGAAIHLFTENSKNATIIVAAPNLASPIQNKLPYDEEAFVNNPIILDVWNAKETGKNIFNKFYSFKEKNKYFAYVFKHNSLEILPQAVRDSILQADSYTASFIAEKHSLLGANSWTHQQFSENDFEILKRIAKVFEQAYIRFLDLQKAEALAVRAGQDLIEIKAARKKAEDTLTKLKSTQAQLIQSEKMASLGELTAGIAHEIQNPLNFVNNFSEINKELVAELKHEARSGNTQEVIAIADSIEENEAKIAQHGKRADSIVKGMLEHSRSTKGQKQPTDINALVDEYLRLSFHGVRAKDKSFNAHIKTTFDETIGKIEIVPGDIGRVLLNLFNNAFYAVNEKKRQPDGTFEPVVSVSTQREGDKVILRVKDNGTGIPQKAKDKIFQPFFTTKPTGEGTGLGLSLGYDIIKAHGGEIKLETKEGEGAEFTIILND